jgi:hypothetical protein
MKRLCVVLVICFLIKTVFGQSVDSFNRSDSGNFQIHCEIKSPDNDPISYANIVIPGTGKGCMSNKAGVFRLKVPQKTLNDTFKVSAVGFHSRHIKVKTVYRQTAITLQPKVYQAPTFTVNTPEPKLEIKKLGGWKPLLSGGTAMPEGHQAVTLIQSENTRGYIKKVRIRVRSNEGADLARLWLYAHDNGKPGRHLLQENKIKKLKAEKHWLVFDLKQVKVPFNEACFVGYELLKVKGDLPQFSVRLWKGSNYNYIKEKGETNWTKAPSNHYVVQVFVRGGG